MYYTVILTLYDVLQTEVAIVLVNKCDLIDIMTDMPRLFVIPCFVARS